MSQTKEVWRQHCHLRLTEEEGKWVEDYCKSENRTFGNFVQLAVRRYIQSKTKDK